MRQHVDTAASTSEQQPQQPRDVNAVLGARGYASSNKQIGAGRPVTGRVWNGNAGRARPMDPSDQTLIDHDQRSDGGRRRRYHSNIPALWTDPNGPYPWLLVRKDPHLPVDGIASRTSRISHRAPPALTALACTATSARTKPPARTAPTEAAASSRSSPRTSMRPVTTSRERWDRKTCDVCQQLTEEQLRIRTRLLCILLAVVFLARQHIVLRKLPFVAKLVHSLLVAENAECQEI